MDYSDICRAAQIAAPRTGALRSAVSNRLRHGLLSPQPVTAGQVYEYVIDMATVSNAFRPGHRLRLDVTSSNFPRIDRNMNTGNPLGETTFVGSKFLSDRVVSLQAGAQGSAGQSVVGSSEPAGPNCPFGGERYDAASGTSYVCNGAPGTRRSLPEANTTRYPLGDRFVLGNRHSVKSDGLSVKNQPSRLIEFGPPL